MSSLSPHVFDNDPAGTGNPRGRSFNYRTLSAALRATGALVLIASLSAMLFRGWSSGSDLTRFYTLLTYCGVLATIGVVLGRVVRKNRGARTFLALALGAVSITVAVLGALSYSSFSDAAVALPSFAAWLAPDPGSLMLLVLTALFADIGLSTSSGDARYTRAAGVTLAVGFTINLLVWPSLAGALMGIASGASVLIYGFSVEQKTVFFAGSGALVTGLVHQLYDAFRGFDFGSWNGLVGINTIIVASILERHGPVWRRRIIGWRARFARWEY